MWRVRGLRKAGHNRADEARDEDVQTVLETIAGEINLRKKIRNVTYRRKYHWYVVRFNKLPSAIIPKKCVDEYRINKGETSRKEIINHLLS